MSAPALAVSAAGWGIVALAAVAVPLLIVGLAMVFGQRSQKMTARLADYADMDDPAGSSGGGPVQLAETRVMQQAVGITERVARRTGLLERTALRLEQADLALRPAEAIFFLAAGVVVVFVFGALLFGPAAGALFGVIATLVPLGVVARRRAKRLRAFEDQLPDTLTLLAGALRSGFSLLQAVNAVAPEAREPMQSALQRVFTEARLGRPVEDALADVATRMESKDLEWAVMAVRIQREVGGNLAELLDTVADTMVQRARIRREIRALTAEGRFSAVILGLAPVAFAVMLFVFKPDYLELLFSSALGVLAVIGAGVLVLIGYGWLRKVISIEV